MGPAPSPFGLPLREAVQLFRAIVGGRADAEPDAVLHVPRLCGFLAIRIAGARLRRRQNWTVEYIASRVGDRHSRLSELAMAERSVAVAFTVSYARLGSDQRRLFRLLGLHAGRDVEPYTAAALADVSVDSSVIGAQASAAWATVSALY